MPKILNSVILHFCFFFLIQSMKKYCIDMMHKCDNIIHRYKYVYTYKVHIYILYLQKDDLCYPLYIGVIDKLFLCSVAWAKNF